MIIKYLNINREQYLSDIIKEIPTNTIVFKTLTGIGATHLELNCKRHSIIIEPNVPVIKGKKSKKIMGVMEGIAANDILGYLANTTIKYKKIMVTPESFHKVVDAVGRSAYNLYEDFFLLFDECDKTATDVDFRKSIIAPMNDFFKFRNKAFVSATAVDPSDPRFREQGFSKLIVRPDFDNRIDLKLIDTNSVSLSLKNHLKTYHEEDVVCIFFNSTRGIGLIIDELGIAEECAVFCSKQKAKEFKGSFKRHEHFEPKHIKRYNFFTSRFYSAVDMLMDIKPHVITLTDLYMAEHSMVDPSGDAVQILGRFRNGIASATTIANTRRNLQYMSQEEAKSYLDGSESTYREIETLYLSATNRGAKDTLKEALELVNYANYVYEDRSKNHFLYDHFYHNELLKSYYISPAALANAYRNAQAADRKYFNVESVSETHTLPDKYIRPNNPMLTFREKVENTSRILEELKIREAEKSMFTISLFTDVYHHFKRDQPLIVKGYELLGLDKLLENSGSQRDLEMAIKDTEYKNVNSNFAFIRALQRKFQDEAVIGQTLLLEMFDETIKEFGVPIKATMKEFQRFFKISSRTSSKKAGNKKVRKIISCTHNRW